jgi:hypothetical protein
MPVWCRELETTFEQEKMKPIVTPPKYMLGGPGGLDVITSKR